MEQQREALLGQIWAAQDEAYDLMYEYDSLPHRYGAHILYQSEAHIIDLIGEHPEITVTELAAILKKDSQRLLPRSCASCGPRAGWSRYATQRTTGFIIYT